MGLPICDADNVFGDAIRVWRKEGKYDGGIVGRSSGGRLPIVAMTSVIGASHGVEGRSLQKLQVLGYLPRNAARGTAH